MSEIQVIASIKKKSEIDHNSLRFIARSYWSNKPMMNCRQENLPITSFKDGEFKDQAVFKRVNSTVTD